MPQKRDKRASKEFQAKPTPVAPITLAEHLPEAEVALVLLMGGHPGRSFTIKDEALIGRSPQADILLTDPEVSRCHARVWQTLSRQYIVEDLGSRNGTFVGKTPVKKRILSIGDKIQLGSHTILALTNQWPAEHRLTEQRKLEGMGRLAAGVAHEFNTMFAVIRTSIDHAVSRSSGDPIRPSELRDCLGDMDIALGRAESFTRKLMGFAQRVKLEPAPVNMREVIGDVVRIVRGIGHDIHVEARVDQRLTVMGDRPQLQLVLQNLVNNAIDAMPGGGRLTIGGTMLDEGTEELPGPAVVVSVTDTGSGMDAKTTARIFEPFFTADPAGKGPGLGMAFSHGIIKGHGGTIEVFSKEGRGTTVRALLPLMQVSHEQATADTRRAVPKIELSEQEPEGEE